MIKEGIMGKYLVLFYGEWATTPAKQKKSMDEWTTWFGKLGKAVVVKGGPTMPGKIIRKSGTRDIGANPVAGYSVFQADSLDAAVALAKGCPSIPDGFKVAVYEIVSM
jgi:hypothetical protein